MEDLRLRLFARQITTDEDSVEELFGFQRRYLLPLGARRPVGDESDFVALPQCAQENDDFRVER